MEPWRYRPARDLGMPLGESLRSARREAGIVNAIASAACWSVLRAYMALAHRLRVVGRENLPVGPPFVLIANHASHLDVLSLMAALPGALRRCVLPIAAGDTFFETPRSAFASALLLNALPMWRRNCGRHALAELRERLVGEPCAYALFPEGTRSRSGEMGGFKPGIGMIVAGTHAAVVPCRIRGAFEAWPPQAPRPRRTPIEVTVGPPLSFADRSNARDGWEIIAAECESAVRAL